MEEPFPCSGCGACCRRIGAILSNFNNEPDSELFFPYQYDEAGRCEKLTVDNKCSVYENRPFICSVEKVGALMGMPRSQYFALTISVCNSMMDEDGMPQEYRIK